MFSLWNSRVWPTILPIYTDYKVSKVGFWQLVLIRRSIHVGDEFSLSSVLTCLRALLNSAQQTLNLFSNESAKVSINCSTQNRRGSSWNAETGGWPWVGADGGHTTLKWNARCWVRTWVREGTSWGNWPDMSRIYGSIRDVALMSIIPVLISVLGEGGGRYVGTRCIVFCDFSVSLNLKVYRTERFLVALYDSNIFSPLTVGKFYQTQNGGKRESCLL